MTGATIMVRILFSLCVYEVAFCLLLLFVVFSIRSNFCLAIVFASMDRESW